MDVEKKSKAKTNGSTGLNRMKKRQLKSNVGVAWGKLLSQCPQQGGASITLLEVTGGKGADKVIFSSSGRHAYIFQQLSNDNFAVDVAPSVSILEAHSGSLKRLQFEI